MFHQGGPIDHSKHVPGKVSQTSAASECNASCIAGMALSHFIKLNNKLMKKDPNVVPKQSLLIILDIKSDVCMANNGNDTKHTINISRRMHSVKNVKEWKLHKTVRYERGLQLADIRTKNVGEY